MLKGTRHSPATRERQRISGRAHRARQVAAARIAPREVLEVLKNGTISEKLRPYVRAALEMPFRLLLAKGGEDRVSEMQRVLITSIGRTEIDIAVLHARFLQGDGDPDLATRISTLAGQQRAALSALGLEHVEHDVPSLVEYIAQNAHSAAKANGSDPHPTDAEIAAQGASHGD